MRSSANRSAKLRSACDRCYELKERCQRISATVTCARCDRLGLVCSSNRPIRPAGRRQKVFPSLAAQRKPVVSSTFELSQDISGFLDNAPGLVPEEKELLTFLLGQPENLDCYVVCPSFQTAEQKSLASLLPASLPELKDAYLACAVALKKLRSGTLTANGSHDSVQYVSSALKILRSLPVSSSQDAALCLTLGTVLALSVQSTIGVGVAEICHYCLSTTYPFVGNTVSSGSEEPWQDLLVLLETMDCLVYRRKPTIRIQRRRSENVDRHLGLVSPLLSYYYDLCIISHSLANTTDICLLAHLQRQLDGIQAAVEAWQPSHPDRFVEEFESAEIITLLAQAKVYRLGALLVSHRLRYAFGQEDGQADIWSKEILMELEISQRIAKRSIRYVALPFMVAAIEVRDPSVRTKILQSVDDHVDDFSPILQKAARTFLVRLWHERDLQVIPRWFDSIHKPCPLLQSINVA